MGIYTSYLLDCKACLFVIRIVKNQTYVFRFMFGTKTDLIPQLDGYVPQRSAPINTWIFHKAVEHILAGLDQRSKSAILLIVIRIADSETRKQKKALEDGKQPIGAVRFAKDSKSITLGHFNSGENEAYVLHGCCHIGILEKRFDIREKRGNFVYRHGIEYVFWWYLKLLIFCLLGKKPCRFFYAIIIGYLYLRNLNK